jgi:hypothetical protein
LKKDVFDWHVLPLASPQNLFSILQQLIHLGGNGIKKGINVHDLEGGGLVPLAPSQFSDVRQWYN